MVSVVIAGLIAVIFIFYLGLSGKCPLSGNVPARQTPPEVLAPWILGLVLSGSNAVKNGGFEDGLRDWHLPPGAKLDEVFKYSGKASLRLEGDPTNRLGLTQYLPTLKPNTRYRLRYAIKTRDVIPNTNGPVYFCGVYGAGLNIWAGKGRNLWFPAGSVITGNTRWIVMGFDFDTVPNQSSGTYYLRIDLRNASGVAWFDDVDIQEISSVPGQTTPR